METEIKNKTKARKNKLADLPETMTVKTENVYTIPCIDYRVVPDNEVEKYVLSGYTLVGGAVIKYGCWYQAVMLQASKTVTEEEYDRFRREYGSPEG